MPDEFFITMIFIIGGFFVIGTICGYVAAFKLIKNERLINFLSRELNALRRENTQTQNKLDYLYKRVEDTQSDAPPTEPPTAEHAEAPPPPAPIPEPEPKPEPEQPAPFGPPPPLDLQPTPTQSKQPAPSRAAYTVDRAESTASVHELLERFLPDRIKPSTQAQPDASESFEFKLGSRWGAWIGVVLLLIGVGLGLKYAFELGMITEPMRIALGALLGAAMIGGGEFLRRRDWTVLFRVLTGGGIGVFYLCDYFAFEVYNLAGQTPAFVVACLITLLGVGLAVRHNALSIAVIAVIGGFLSPFLLSTGTNRPYELFTYLFILDLVAMGAAGFRRWNALNALCFVGTVILYQAWGMEYFEPGEAASMKPALIYATLFYLLFLILPATHSLLRGAPREMEGISILVANTLYAVYAFYVVLVNDVTDYRHIVGAIVIAQAAAVFGLRHIWRVRLGSDNRTTESLMVIGVALITLAVPIHLRVYSVPMTWAIESALLAFLGVRHDRLLLRGLACGVAGLAVFALFRNLPIDTTHLTPVFNTPFAAWMLTVASLFAQSAIYRKFGVNAADQTFGQILNAAAAALLTIAVPVHFDGYTVPTLWAVIAFLLTFTGWRLDRPIYSYAGVAVSALAGVYLLRLLPMHRGGFQPVLNTEFTTWLAVIASAVGQTWIHYQYRHDLLNNEPETQTDQGDPV
ncbi:MAG: DUF2339 domain-containing protein, partial [Planctomycetota bacterium]